MNFDPLDAAHNAIDELCRMILDLEEDSPCTKKNLNEWRKDPCFTEIRYWVRKSFTKSETGWTPENAMKLFGLKADEDGILFSRKRRTP